MGRYTLGDFLRVVAPTVGTLGASVFCPLSVTVFTLIFNLVGAESLVVPVVRDFGVSVTTLRTRFAAVLRLLW